MPTSAPQILDTERLRLRRPRSDDVEAIYVRYASDPNVTKYLGWARHRSIEDTQAFIAFSDNEWKRHPVGSYLIEDRSGRLLGGTGLGCESHDRATTGYVLAQDAWGLGYATEALTAMVRLARDLGLREVSALCHTEHRASARVLQKCGFELDGLLERHLVFPNLDVAGPLDVFRYTIALADAVQ